MSKLTELLTNIANAIRSKKGTTEPINAQNFASEIEGIKGNTLKNLLDYTKSASYLFYQTEITDLTGYLEYEDTSNVISMSSMCRYCRKLTILPPIDSSNVNYMDYIFDGCSSLITISQLDIRNCKSFAVWFGECRKLTNLTLLNIKINIQVGYSTSFGHLLTLESLIGLCQQCVNVGSSRKLTVGSANITKLSDVYVKLTGEPEEDETLPKLPMVQCESTDEGAMTIAQYMLLKNWALA